MKHVIVVGGGAAGMMAAIAAARAGSRVSLYEKNDKLGRKIYITGKGRCNLTNACEEEDFLAHVCVNRKFLYSSFSRFTNRDTMNFFTDSGLKIKTERGNRVFPVSDHASDVIAVLAGEMKRLGVSVNLNTAVKEILTVPKEGEDIKVSGVMMADGREVPADAVIVCTGGLSYPSTGSTGDGYTFAGDLGHKISPLSPSLVPMEIKETDAALLQGLSLRNVNVKITDGKKVLFEEFGEMMFTHFGVTGPLILSASAAVQKKLKADHPLTMKIDLKPAITMQQLDARFLREFEANKNRQLKNVLGALYPATLVPVIISRSEVSPEKVIHDLSKQERRRLAELTKELCFTITGLRGYQEAVITRGGVNVGQVRPDTMESKLVKRLYFAGEVLDLDAVTGGFNLQIAWTTGNAAGAAAGSECGEE